MEEAIYGARYSTAYFGWQKMLRVPWHLMF